MSGEAMLNAGIEVKVEDYDGTYVLSLIHI